MAKKKISIGTWAFIWGGYQEKPIPLDLVLDRLRELNFNGIEFGAFPPHFESNNDSNRKRIRKMLLDHELEVSAVSAPTPSPAMAKAGDYLDVIKANLDLCEEIGSPKLRIDSVEPPTKVPGDNDYETCFSRVAEVWHEAAEECRRRRIRLIWEFEPGFLFNKPSEVVRMAYRVNHDYFSILFDSCHAYMCGTVGARQMGQIEVLPGGIAQFAHMLTGKIGHVHLIDSDGTLHDGQTSTHSPLGTGKLDFSEVIRAIVEAGYKDDWWPIDLCFWPNALDVTAENKKVMERLIKAYV